MILFLCGGFSTFRRASHGCYDIQTDVVRKMRDDLLADDISKVTDKSKLRADISKVVGDFRSAYDKYKECHEQEADKQ